MSSLCMFFKWSSPGGMVSSSLGHSPGQFDLGFESAIAPEHTAGLRAAQEVSSGPLPRLIRVWLHAQPVFPFVAYCFLTPNFSYSSIWYLILFLSSREYFTRIYFMIGVVRIHMHSWCHAKCDDVRNPWLFPAQVTSFRDCCPTRRRVVSSFAFVHHSRSAPRFRRSYGDSVHDTGPDSRAFGGRGADAS